MYARQVDVPDIVSRVVVANLATGPVKAFDLYDFVVFDGTAKGNLDTSEVVLGLSLGIEAYCQDAIGSIPDQQAVCST